MAPGVGDLGVGDYAVPGRPCVLVAVCADPEVAAVLMGQGARVVFYGADAERLAEPLTALRAGGSRVGVLIGDPSDPQVEATARTMAAELFGGNPVVVDTVSHARQLGTGSGTVDPHPDD